MIIRRKGHSYGVSRLSVPAGLRQCMMAKTMAMTKKITDVTIDALDMS